MAALPYMQFHVAEYLADTSHLSTEEHGAYLLLIFNYWQRGKALDNSNGRLANVVRMSNARWLAVAPRLHEFFTVDGDLWTHTRIEQDLEAVNAKCEQARNARAQRKICGRSTGVATDVGTDVQRGANDKKRVLREERREEEVAPSMVATMVLQTLSLSGQDLLRNLTDIARAKMSAGMDPMLLKELMIAAHTRYLQLCVDGKLEAKYRKQPHKFYGDGDWENESLWPWKDGQKPAAITKTKYLEIPE